jgi:hypothetical protein
VDWIKEDGFAVEKYQAFWRKEMAAHDDALIAWGHKLPAEATMHLAPGLFEDEGAGQPKGARPRGVGGEEKKEREADGRGEGGRPNRPRAPRSGGEEEGPVTHEERWEKNYQELKSFRDEEGHCNVPKDRTFKTLWTWVMKQRYLHRNGTLRETRAARLDGVGFAWEPCRKERATLPLAGTPADEETGSAMPVASNPTLDLMKYPWEGKNACYDPWDGESNEENARNRVKNQEETEEKEGRVGIIGLANRGKWDRQFRELAQFRDERGHCNVPQNERLGRWVCNQRAAHRSGTLAGERFARLEGLGFVWGPGRGRSRRRSSAEDGARASETVAVKRRQGADKRKERKIMSRECPCCAAEYDNSVIPAILSCCRKDMCLSCCEKDNARQVAELTGNRKRVSCMWCQRKYHCVKQVPWTVNELACALLGIDADSLPPAARPTDAPPTRAPKRARAGAAQQQQQQPQSSDTETAHQRDITQEGEEVIAGTHERGVSRTSSLQLQHHVETERVALIASAHDTEETDEMKDVDVDLDEEGYAGGSEAGEDEFASLARKSRRLHRIRQFVAASKSPQDRLGRKCSSWSINTSSKTLSFQNLWRWNKL